MASKKGTIRGLSNRTRVGSAEVQHSGSGDINYLGGFAPTSTVPINGSNLPHRHSNFVGREDEIRKTVEALASRAWIVTIDGMGGIGKTTLALEVAYRCKEQQTELAQTHDFEGYIWASARGKPDFGLEDVVREILFVLSPFESNSRQLSMAEQTSLAIRALGGAAKLLIIDNFESVHDEKLHLFIRDSIPAPSKVLITSRHHIKEGERVINVGGLEEADAVKLLRAEAERLDILLEERDTERLHIIARKCFGVPFALKWAMESVANGKSLEWVLASLEQATAEDLFAYIFNLSLALLDTPTFRVFCSLSLFPTWTTYPTIAAINPNVPALEDRLSQLVVLSLIDTNRVLIQADRRYQIPPFARYIATRELSALREKQEILRNAVGHYLSRMSTIASHNATSMDTFVAEEFSTIQNLIENLLSYDNANLLAKAADLAHKVSRYDERGEALLQAVFSKSADLMQGAKSSTKISTIRGLRLRLLANFQNPFVIGSPVTNARMFKGREDLIQEILSVCHGSYPLLNLVGPRRIGKTSLLRHIESSNTEHYLYAYVDAQRLSRSGSHETLFALADSIYREAIRIGYQLAEPDGLAFAERKDPALKFEDYLYDLAIATGKQRIVLAIDEYEVILGSRYRNHEGDLHLPSYFRYLLQSGNVSMILSGAISLEDIAEDDPNLSADSPLLNIATYSNIPLLTHSEAVSLLQDPLLGVIDLEPDILDSVLRLCGQHPALLQQFGSLLVKHCLSKKIVSVDAASVELVTYQLLSEAGTAFRISSQFPRERAFLEALSEIARAAWDNGNQVEAPYVEQVLDRYRYFIRSDRPRWRPLKHLVRDHILAARDNGVYYFPVELYLRWLANWPGPLQV
jgi:hypothetical protein